MAVAIASAGHAVVIGTSTVLATRTTSGPKPPKVVKEIEPKEMTIPGKRKLHLQCKIAGFPAPTIKWYRDGNEIKVRKGVLVSQDAAGGANLVLEKCETSDAGVYSAKGKEFFTTQDPIVFIV